MTFQVPLKNGSGISRILHLSATATALTAWCCQYWKQFWQLLAIIHPRLWIK